MSKLIELLQKGLESNPGDWNIRKGLIEQYAQAKDSKALEEIIESAPEMCGDEGIAVVIAEMLADSSDGAATKFIEGATEKFPTNSRLHGVAAKMQLASGDMSAAFDHYEAAKTFDPNFSDSDLDSISHLMASASGKLAEPKSPVEDVSTTVLDPEPQQIAGTTPADPLPEIQPAESFEPVVEEVAFTEPVIDDPEFAPPSPTLINTQSVKVLDDLQPSAVPIAPLTQPLEAPELAYEEVTPVVDLSFTPEKELELTRNHLAVVTPEGETLDADHYSQVEQEHLEEKNALLVAEAAEAPDAAERSENKDRVVAIIGTILAHVVLFLLISLIIVAAPRMKPPEIVAVAGPISNEQTITKKKIVQQTPTKPPAASASVMSTITSSAVSSVSVPTVEFQAPDTPVELGSTFGSGISFGTGGAVGGEISFMGNTGTGKSVVFAVDYSLSMGRYGTDKYGDFLSASELSQLVKSGKEVRRHHLVRNELIKSIKKLPRGTQYQIVMFSGKAYAHDAVDPAWLKSGKFYSKAGRDTELLAELKKNKDLSYAPKGASKYSDYEFPKFKYIQTSPDTIKKSVLLIEKMPTTYGTNWEHPVLMALSIRPRPDVVFFMTDGLVTNPTRALELIADANKGKATQIHTTALMEPKAAADMAELAAQNRGQFTLVVEGGKIITEQEFFNGKKR